MTANYTYLVDTGVVSADTADVLSDVQSEYRTALGENLNVASSTPQGTLIAGETTARTGVMKNNAELANNINPNLAYGTFLDAVCALLGVERGDQSSTVGTDVQLVGNSGTVVLAGSRVSTSDGEVFTVKSQVTIPSSGKANAIITAVNTGVVPLAVQSMTILDGIIGWGECNVTSTTTVVLGTTSLNDPNLKNRRNQSLFRQGRSSIGAIRAELLGTANVTSCIVIDNNTGAAGLVNGVDFTVGNGTWICVSGTATDAEIASAIWESCQGAIPFDFGADGNGTPVQAPNGVSVIDSASGVSYQVKFTRSIQYDAYVNITVSQGSSSADPQVAVANSIVNWADGNVEGEFGLITGASLSGWEVAGAVNRDLPGMYVKYVEVAAVLEGESAPTSFSQEVVANKYDEFNISIGRVKVTVV